MWRALAMLDSERFATVVLDLKRKRSKLGRLQEREQQAFRNVFRDYLG
jgi:hypothetical protein